MNMNKQKQGYKNPETLEMKIGDFISKKQALYLQLQIQFLRLIVFLHKVYSIVTFKFLRKRSLFRLDYKTKFDWKTFKLKAQIIGKLNPTLLEPRHDRERLQAIDAVQTLLITLRNPQRK